MLKMRFWAILWLVVVFPSGASARDTELIGVWQKHAASVFVEFTQQGDTIIGVVIRDDWSPDEVGKQKFYGLEFSEKADLWKGKLRLSGSSKLKTVKIVKSKDNEFLARTRTGSAKKVLWKRVEDTR